MTDNEKSRSKTAIAEFIKSTRFLTELHDNAFEEALNTLDKETLIFLLKHQKAEIERLQKDSERLKKVQMQLDDAMKMYSTIKAEAIKEFAERLIKEADDVQIDSEGDFIFSDSDNTSFEIYDTVAEWCKEITNYILKEMVGDAE